MADTTIAEAFGVVGGSSTEETDLRSALTTLQTKITDAATAGAFSTDVRDQLLSQVVDLAEEIASNMTEHTS